MTIATDMHARLTAALGQAVPVLLPEQIELPRAGRTPGQRGGIPAYLVEHPQGYVQIEKPLSITSDSLTGTFWVAVAALHLNEQGCADLAQQVRRALCGTPIEPGAYQEVTPAQPERLQEGVWLMRPTFQAFTLDGVPVT